MPTKAEQARINGAKSKGATSPEGLDRCRQASVKHGMWAKHMSSFSQEEQDNYASVLDSATKQFRPRNTMESSIVALLADAVWRAGRLGALANCEIYREGWVINNLVAEDKDLGMIERRELADRASHAAERVEARTRHYVREINRLIETLRKLQAWPVPGEASQEVNENTASAPNPPAQTAIPEPEPERKPVQRASNRPRQGSVPRRR